MQSLLEAQLPVLRQQCLLKWNKEVHSCKLRQRPSALVLTGTTEDPTGSGALLHVLLLTSLAFSSLYVWHVTTSNPTLTSPPIHQGVILSAPSLALASHMDYFSLSVPRRVGVMVRRSGLATRDTVSHLWGHFSSYRDLC